VGIAPRVDESRWLRIEGAPSRLDLATEGPAQVRPEPVAVRPMHETNEPRPSDDAGAFGRSGPSPSDPSRSPGERGTPPWLRAVADAARSVVLALLVLLVVRAFVVEAFKIPTSSMEGTLLAGDFLLVNKAVYGAEIPGVGMTLPALADPERGEVIVFNPPHEPSKHYVKRLVGMPGDTLMMRDKTLYLNSTPLAEPYARYGDPHGDAVHPGMAWQSRFLADGPRPGRYRPSRDNWGPIVIPGDRYFVLGDNRDNSEDSRYWGLVTRENIRGRPWIVYYSSEPQLSPGLGWLREVRWERIGGRIR
jgi:signal peptidase I